MLQAGTAVLLFARLLLVFSLLSAAKVLPLLQVFIFDPTIQIFVHIMFVSHYYAHAGKLSFFTIFPTEILERQIYHDA